MDVHSHDQTSGGGNYHTPCKTETRNWKCVAGHDEGAQRDPSPATLYATAGYQGRLKYPCWLGESCALQSGGAVRTMTRSIGRSLSEDRPITGNAKQRGMN
jgi:hypothetical protein